jgi:hypothetical protein
MYVCYVCMYVRMCVYLYVCKYVCMYVCMCVYVQVGMYLSVYVCMYTLCIYIGTHASLHPVYIYVLHFTIQLSVKPVRD